MHAPNLEQFQTVHGAPGWSDLLFGLIRGFVRPNEVVSFAGDALEQDWGQVEHLVVSLAITQPDDREGVLDGLSLLARTEGLAAEDVPLRRWRYVALKHVVDQYKESEEIFEHIATVWSDYESRSDMRHLIYYLPARYESSAPQEARARLLGEIHRFIVMEGTALS